jgi:hypothetical protein
MFRSKAVCFVVLLAAWSNVQAVAQASPPQTGISHRVDVPNTDTPTPTAPPSPVNVPVSVPVAPPVNVPPPSHPDAIVVPPQPIPVAKKISPDNKRLLPFSRLAIGIKVSTLGVGGQIAVPLTRGLNLRGGVDFFNFGASATVDGARYEGQIHLKNGQLNLDWFPFNGPIHISPGLVIFKSALSASINVAGGNSFSLGNNTFTSNPSDPINGSASILFSHSVMPSLTIGIGNMISRGSKHWSAPLEIGAVYTGHYTAQMNLTGSACITLGCMSTTSTLLQQSIADEVSGLNEPMKHYQLYPILTSGLSYRF